MKKKFLVIILVLFCINFSNIVIAPSEKSADTLLKLTFGDESRYYTLNDLLTFDSITGNGGRKNVINKITSPKQYTGILISTLAQEFTEMPSKYHLQAISDDGYILDYTFDDVQGNVMVYDDKGKEIGVGGVSMVLATMENGETGYYGSLRIVFINEAEPITFSALWAKWVVEIRFIPLPTVSIVKPKNDIYLYNNEIISFSQPFIIGGINIYAEINDYVDISKVLFKIDDVLKYEANYSSPSYIWFWDETAILYHTISVIVYDKQGNINTAEKKVFIINT